MELETLQAANNLKYSIEKCKNQLNTLNSDRAMRTIRVYETGDNSFDIRTDQEEYADIVKVALMTSLTELRATLRRRSNHWKKNSQSYESYTGTMDVS